MKRILTLLAVGAVVIVLWWAMLNWISARLVPRSIATVQSFFDEFYTKYNAKDYSYIFRNMTVREFQDAWGYERFRDLLDEVYQGVGKYKNRQLYSWRLSQRDEGTFLYVENDVTYERGTTNENFLLKRTEDSWLITDYEFE